MDKFFTFLDKYRKWILLACFVLQVLFVTIYGTARTSSMLYSCYSIGIWGTEMYPLSYRLRFIISFYLIILSLLLSLISVVCAFFKKTFLFSIPLGVLFFSVLLSVFIFSYTGDPETDTVVADSRGNQIVRFVYFFIVSFLALATSITLELLSKYRDRLIKKAQPEPSENTKSVD